MGQHLSGVAAQLVGQRHFRSQQKDAAPVRKAMARQFQIDGRLAAAGHAVEQAGGGLRRIQRAGHVRQGGLLGGIERKGGRGRRQELFPLAVFIRRLHELQRPRECRMRLVAHPEGARLVGAVAVQAAALVHQHHAVFREHGGLFRSIVGKGGIGVHGHDGGKAQFRGSVFTVEFFYGPGHGGFILPGNKHGGQPVEHAVIELHRGVDAADFLLILDFAQLFHKAVRSLERKPRFQPPGIAQGKVFLFYADDAGSAAQLFQKAVERFGRGGMVDEYALPVPELAGGLLIARIGAQPVLAVLHDDEAARTFVALAVVQLEAGKVEAVGALADQKGVQPFFIHEAAQFFSAQGKGFFVHGILWPLLLREGGVFFVRSGMVLSGPRAAGACAVPCGIRA